MYISTFTTLEILLDPDLVAIFKFNLISFFTVLLFFREEVEEMAKRLKVKLFRASVKEDFNIEECE